MPEGVNAAMSEKEQIKDVFRELLGEMPAFPEWCKDSGEARLQLKQRSWAPRVPDAPGSQAKEQQAKVSGVKHSRIVGGLKLRASVGRWSQWVCLKRWALIEIILGQGITVTHLEWCSR